MDTYFAPAKRTEEKELVAEIRMVNKNPILSGLLHSIGGLLAILDERRQIIAINDSFLKMLGINNPSEALGLRPGEALKCIHSDEEPGGCGTTKFCSTCGAAIAIVASLKGNKPCERICALTANRRGEEVDIALLVRSQPIEIKETKVLLLFLKDITVEQQRAALERTFFHDINNMLSGLLGASEMLVLENNQSNLVKIIHKSSLRLKNELDIQKCLSQSGTGAYQPLWQKIDAGYVMEELQACFANHSAAKNKKIIFPANAPSVGVKTDMSLLLRILSNMLTNALEASEKNETVKLSVEHKNSFLIFGVWNKSPIPQNIAQRIFQRNFSTKEGAGRGVGTYSMKLFGEQILGGKINFTTSNETGTMFTLSLPV